MTTRRLIPKRFRELPIIAQNDLASRLETDEEFYRFVSASAQRLDNDVELNATVSDYVLARFSEALQNVIKEQSDVGVGIVTMEQVVNKAVTFTVGQYKRTGFELAMITPMEHRLLANRALAWHLTSVGEDENLASCMRMFRMINEFRNEDGPSFEYTSTAIGHILDMEGWIALQRVYSMEKETPILLVSFQDVSYLPLTVIKKEDKL